ncbi:hemin-degrading factor [Curvibacter sp. CHRR-16]|uniref:hemin-degrading factor n=1 Tax=Curvibacter sp. CHRR-16 TaxID=2835872 RepID=UPI001BDA56F8|nr:ChuX/HutX family heme-like substrate-binding protein [Curvibacter sp. CHRR-16]MBT0568866.1 hemin-degrading factor [Curvibacter sp. CHRR-16]
MNPNAIRLEAAELRRSSRMRHVEVAQSLGISECQLVAAHAGSVASNAVLEDAASGIQAVAGTIYAVRLRAEWPAMLAALEAVGQAMALTRNHACVHEKTGTYYQSSVQDGVGLVLGGAIDLRVFYRHWAHGFAVCERTEKGMQNSLQFFDTAGCAIHKVFAKPMTDMAAWYDLVQRFANADQTPSLVLTPDNATVPDAASTELADAAVDLVAFRQAWASLRDTHDFGKLLKQFGVGRLQALRLADPQYVQAVEPAAAHSLLQAAARDQVPIMVFVANAGMVQIHTGPVHKIVVMGPWVNVLDDDFNLHLRQDLIASAWVVRKPTVDGMVTSLELLDEKGQLIAQFFGARKPGARELCEWRGLIEQLLLENDLCNA